MEPEANEMLTLAFQPNHVDTAIQIFRPILVMAIRVLCIALWLGAAVLLAYSITGIGSYILAHRTCGRGRHTLSVALVAFLFVLSVRSQVDDNAAGFLDFLWRNLQIFSSFIVLSGLVLALLVFGTALKCAFMFARNGDLPRALPPTRRLASCLAFPLIIHYSAASFDWSTDDPSWINVADFRAIIQTAVLMMFLVLVKIIVFLVCWFAVAVAFMSMASVSLDILKGTSIKEFLTNFWKRARGNDAPRKEDICVRLGTVLCCMFHIPAFDSLYAKNSHAKNQIVEKFWVTTAQVMAGWLVFHLSMVVLSVIARVIYLLLGGCIVPSQEDEELGEAQKAEEGKCEAKNVEEEKSEVKVAEGDEKPLVDFE
ncbi:uncharacterized protein RCC_07114 [Ramularia collo-cygni]|uniref:Uncharacterized protein n=1 Tax=Ramularia collo-cygni TaxID=112498 RepID=A0A2D3UWS4_9PEZI|nr:uncharacterized protein RCC_07114 [Ramularia collo-cygni]CZT21251.1 uncharacterized protein RCC_07114 [Ramularia collo-cygni]